MNALTHGLKSVGKAATTLLFRTNITDKIKEHSSLPENIGNFVTVEFERLQEGIKIIVKDMSGKFFDVQELLSKKETKASLDIHGRGLKAIYRLCGESLDTMLSSSSNDQTASEKSAPIFKGLMSSPNTDNQGQTIGTAVEFTVLSIAPKKEMDSKPKGSSNFKP